MNSDSGGAYVLPAGYQPDAPLAVEAARRRLDELESVVTGDGDCSGVVFVATRPDCKPSCRDPWKVTIRERVNAHLMQVMALAEKGCTGRRGARLAHRYVDGKTVHFGGVVERSEFMAGALEANELKALIGKDRMCQGVGVFGFAVGFVRLEHFRLHEAGCLCPDNAPGTRLDQSRDFAAQT